MIRIIKKLLKPISNTPVHPQWLAKQGGKTLVSYLKDIGENKTVLDVGCFNKWPENVIPANSTYYGLDYLETAEQWYKSIPDCYADARELPIANSSVDVVLLLDVLEHISDTMGVFSETSRVLKKGGCLIMQVPFLYPLHDEPRDYFRFTEHGFRILAEQMNFKIQKITATGHPLETATLMLNIAFSKSIYNWFTAKNPLLTLVLILPLFTTITNILAKLLALLSKSDSFMPSSYQLVLIKE